MAVTTWKAEPASTYIDKQGMAFFVPKLKRRMAQFAVIRPRSNCIEGGQHLPHFCWIIITV